MLLGVLVGGHWELLGALADSGVPVPSGTMFLAEGPWAPVAPGAMSPPRTPR